jgi:hypothetical protein
MIEVAPGAYRDGALDVITYIFTNTGKSTCLEVANVYVSVYVSMALG